MGATDRRPCSKWNKPEGVKLFAPSTLRPCQHGLALHHAPNARLEVSSPPVFSALPAPEVMRVA